MHAAILQSGHVDTALTVAFSPIVLGFIVGALPVLIPVLVVRALSRLIGGNMQGESS